MIAITISNKTGYNAYVIIFLILFFIFFVSDSNILGLPRWEYILHLFVNGFHFASIAVFLTLKLNLTPNGITIVPNFYQYENFKTFQFIVTNLIPGAILIAIIHIVVSIPKTAIVWNNFRTEITCC